MSIADHEHQPGIAGDLHTDTSDDVVALLAAGELDLAHEDVAGPRLGVRRLFDLEDLGDVSAPERLDHELLVGRSAPQESGENAHPWLRADALVDQLMRASGARR